MSLLHWLLRSGVVIGGLSVSACSLLFTVGQEQDISDAGDADAFTGPNLIVGVSAVWNSSCVVDKRGGAYCWGANGDGQTGTETMEVGVPSPVGPVLDHGIPLVGAQSIAVGEAHGCALLTSGAMNCWGDNNNGQLGRGFESDTELIADPVSQLAPIVQFSARGPHTCAVSTDQSLYCWGRDGAGEAGNGEPGEDISLPAQVQYLDTTLVDNARSVSVGRYHTCFISTDDETYCFGWNIHGQAGVPDVGYPSSAMLVDSLPGPTRAVSAGYKHSCAVLVDGSIYCWGINDDGQLGTGTDDAGCTPAVDDVPGDCLLNPPARILSNAFVDACTPSDVSVGRSHSCVLCEEGQILCWGDGGSGRLGNGGSTPSSEAVRVMGIDDAVALSVGDTHACAVHASGTVSCWGENDHGQLAAPELSSSNLPVDIPGLPVP